MGAGWSSGHHDGSSYRTDIDPLSAFVRGQDVGFPEDLKAVSHRVRGELSLLSVLRDPYLQRLFKGWLVEQSAESLLTFWMECDDYNRIAVQSGRNIKLLQARASEIYKRYLEPGHLPNSLELDAETCEEIAKVLSQLNKDLVVGPFKLFRHQPRLSTIFHGAMTKAFQKLLFDYLPGFLAWQPGYFREVFADSGCSPTEEQGSPAERAIAVTTSADTRGSSVGGESSCGGRGMAETPLMPQVTAKNAFLAHPKVVLHVKRYLGSLQAKGSCGGKGGGGGGGGEKHVGIRCLECLEDIWEYQASATPEIRLEHWSAIQRRYCGEAGIGAPILDALAARAPALAAAAGTAADPPATTAKFDIKERNFDDVHADDSHCHRVDHHQRLREGQRQSPASASIVPAEMYPVASLLDEAYDEIVDILVGKHLLDYQASAHHKDLQDSWAREREMMNTSTTNETKGSSERVPGGDANANTGFAGGGGGGGGRYYGRRVPRRDPTANSVAALTMRMRASHRLPIQRCGSRSRGGISSFFGTHAQGGASGAGSSGDMLRATSPGRLRRRLTASDGDLLRTVVGSGAAFDDDRRRGSAGSNKTQLDTRYPHRQGGDLGSLRPWMPVLQPLTHHSSVSAPCVLSADRGVLPACAGGAAVGVVGDGEGPGGGLASSHGIGADEARQKLQDQCQQRQRQQQQWSKSLKKWISLGKGRGTGGVTGGGPAGGGQEVEEEGNEAERGRGSRQEGEGGEAGTKRRDDDDDKEEGEQQQQQQQQQKPGEEQDKQQKRGIRSYSLSALVSRPRSLDAPGTPAGAKRNPLLDMDTQDDNIAVIGARRARLIYETYVSEGAEKQVNLSSRLREIAKHNVENFERMAAATTKGHGVGDETGGVADCVLGQRDIFDGIQREVFQLMESNLWTSFKHSKRFEFFICKFWSHHARAAGLDVPVTAVKNRHGCARSVGMISPGANQAARGSAPSVAEQLQTGPSQQHKHQQEQPPLSGNKIIQNFSRSPGTISSGDIPNATLGKSSTLTADVASSGSNSPGTGASTSRWVGLLARVQPRRALLLPRNGHSGGRPEIDSGSGAGIGIGVDAVDADDDCGGVGFGVDGDRSLGVTVGDGDTGPDCMARDG